MPKKSLPQEAKTLLDQLDKRSATSAESGKRQFPRHAYRTQAQLLRRTDDGSLMTEWIQTRDLSVEGLGCLHIEALPAGTPVSVLLKSAAGTNPIGGQVAHCQAVKNDFYLVGLRFEQRIDPEDYLSVS